MWCMLCRLNVLCILLFAASVISLPNLIYAESEQDQNSIILPTQLNEDLINNVFKEANKRSVNDVPGSKFFGISLRVWPYGDHSKKIPSYQINLRFRHGGSISSYEWDSQKKELKFFKDTHWVMGLEDSTCKPNIWSDFKRLNSLILFGYDKIDKKLFTKSDHGFYDLNTNALEYNCSWQLWFFNSGNIGSFLLDNSGPKTKSVK